MPRCGSPSGSAANRAEPDTRHEYCSLACRRVGRGLIVGRRSAFGGGSMIRFALSTGLASLLLVTTAAPARADWLITPYLGSAFGGDNNSQHVTYGASAARMSHGIVGVEFDGSIAPDLLDEDDGVVLGIADSNVTTVMGSLVIGAPFGGPGVRPYVMAGAGLVKCAVTQ